MTSTDIKHTIEFLQTSTIFNNISTVAILSPTTELPYYQNIFKNIEILDINQWNLDNKIDKQFDLIIAHNIFQMTKTPILWFNNVMNSCTHFLIQDLLKRQRDPNGEFCKTDLDSTRYSFNNHKYYNGDTFNISSLQYHIINAIIYDGERNEYDSNPKHFACLIEKSNDT